MKEFKAGEFVKVRMSRERRGHIICQQHRGGVETDGLFGQVVGIWPERDHSISLQFNVWDHGTPWLDSFHPDELLKLDKNARPIEE